MKRIIALLLCAGIFAVAAAGCFGGGPQITATGDEAANTNVSAYQNTYKDLLTYLSALGYINPLEKNEDITYSKMRGDLIGAKQGKRFTAINAKDVTIEIYEFDPAQHNATADQVLGSVRETGGFNNLFGDNVDGVYLSKHERYMMIYNDRSITADSKDTDDNVKTRQEVVEHFVAFDR